jgi:uncharacterized protein (DUF2236 family)
MEAGSSAARDREEGYFPRGRSVLRRVHGERVVGSLYGQRALLIQACHPLAFAGLTANTRGLEAPFRRLASTAKTMEAVYFGTVADADRQTARVRALHAGVRGRLAAPAGRYPEGSSYRADSPELLLWILACLADSAETVYERFVRRLAPSEGEAYWADYLRLGQLFGLSRDDAPPTYRSYRAYLRSRLESDDLHVIPEARELGLKVAFDLPLPTHRAPALAAINLAVVGLLPPRVRALYGLDWGSPQALALEALVRASRTLRPVVPHAVRRGASAGDYDVVARTEAQRAAREPRPPAVAGAGAARG